MGVKALMDPCFTLIPGCLIVTSFAWHGRPQPSLTHTPTEIKKADRRNLCALQGPCVQIAAGSSYCSTSQIMTRKTQAWNFLYGGEEGMLGATPRWVGQGAAVCWCDSTHHHNTPSGREPLTRRMERNPEELHPPRNVHFCSPRRNSRHIIINGKMACFLYDSAKRTY
jgi:hypothetical protein